MKTERVTIAVADGTEMSAYVARPEGDDSYPALLIFQEAFGGNAHIRDITERFAKEGYIAIAPELFHRTAPGFESEYVFKEGVQNNMGALTDEGLVADVKATYEWLQQQSFVAKEKIGAVGFCMGGKTAFLANAKLPLAAAVSFYGGGIATTHLPLAKDLHGPTLFLWGGKDVHIPISDRNAITEALTEVGKDFTNIEFSYANHGFFCDAREAYSPRAASEAWPLVLAFLKGNLQ